MKKVLMLVLASAFAISALAGPGNNKDKTPKTIKCAVQGDSLNVADATKHHMYADYKGRRYFFCCNGCPQAFKKNPAKYSKSQSIPTPKADKPQK